ncbi:MAG: serine/threonine-protein kinase [Pirellulales bacterium]
MTLQANQCDHLPLELLLSDGEGASAENELTDHVARCETCQSRLTALAADATWWNDARESLSDGAEFAWTPDASWSSRITPDRPANRDLRDSAVRKLLAPPSHPELLGRLGRYDIERVIGAGGMGIVLKAHDSELNRPIAVKVLAAHLAHVGAARERFAREGRAAAAVVHEHVVAIYNVESDGEMPFLVMQYVPGRSLQSRVDAEGPLAVEEILRIGMQAASGLAAAHAQGLVHRDVKPSNILLEETVERAVLTDFGLARTIDDASLTHTGVLAGTPHYMSPEQATGGAVDHRSDLFGLGAVLYFMATGHPPFRADGALAVLHRICREPHRPVWQTNNEIPDELSDLIDRLLEKKPNRRPASAAEVSAQLAAQLSRIQQFGPSRRRLDGWRGRRARRRIIGLAAATLVTALAIGVVYRIAGTPIQSAGEPTDIVQNYEIHDAFKRELKLDSNYEYQLEAAREAVQRSDTKSSFVAPGDDPWTREVETIRHELSELESEQGLSP